MLRFIKNNYMFIFIGFLCVNIMIVAAGNVIEKDYSHATTQVALVAVIVLSMIEYKRVQRAMARKDKLIRDQGKLIKNMRRRILVLREELAYAKSEDIPGMDEED